MPNEVVKLSPFVVSASSDSGYAVRDSIGSTRVNVPISHVPSYITVLNAAFLKDIQAKEVGDIVQYVSGMARSSSGIIFEQWSIRGYEQSGTYRDGLPDRDYGNDMVTANYVSTDRIEVLKGPAGVMYGSHGMGGIVNRISKWPTPRPMTEVQVGFETGHNEYISGAFDTSRSLGKEGGVSYRLAAATQRGDFVWGGLDNRLQASGVIQTRFGQEQAGRAWLRVNWMDNKSNPESGAQRFVDAGFNPVAGFGGRDIRKFAAYEFQEDPVSTNHGLTSELGFETAFSALGTEWNLRLIGRYWDNDGDRELGYSSGNPIAVNSNYVAIGTSTQILQTDPRLYDWRTSYVNRYFFGYNKGGFGNFDLAGDFALGPTRHQLVINGIFGMTDVRRQFYFWNVTNPADPLGQNTFSIWRDIAESRAVSSTFTRTNSPRQFNNLNGIASTNNFAWGVQDNISLFNDRLIFVAGTRYDWFQSTNTTTNANLVATTVATTKNQDWTYKLGIVGRITDSINVFAHKSTTFQPISTINTATGEKFPNQQGEVIEGGFKFITQNERISATISVFDMKLTNVLQSVLAPPSSGGGTILVPAGVQNTQGWEIDGVFQPIRGLNLLIGYSDLTSTAANGLAFRGVPQTATWSAFAKYEFQTGALQGFGIGAGWKHIGEKPADAANTFFMQASDAFDVHFYVNRSKRWSATVSVLNITDSDALWSAVATTSVVPTPPRAVRMNVTYKF